jgi:hypothetical protein
MPAQANAAVLGPPHPPPVEPWPVVVTAPWCVWCAGLLRLDSHDTCRSNLDGSLWTPCLTCHGGRLSADGSPCDDCLGVGFWEYDSLEAAVGGATSIDVGGADD